MHDLVDTIQMYLRTVYELEEDGVVPLRARIAEHLGQSGPTVSGTVGRMVRDGLLQVAPDRRLELTGAGRGAAVRVMRKHRLAELMFTEVVGLDLAEAHEEACRWEHVLGERVERRLVALLPDPTVSPWGNPVPGLDELGVAAGPVRAAGGRTVALARAVPVGAGPVELVLRRVGETLQVDAELVGALLAAGLRPGAVVRAERGAGTVRLQGPDGQLLLPLRRAAHLFVGSPVDTGVPAPAGPVAAPRHGGSTARARASAPRPQPAAAV